MIYFAHAVRDVDQLLITVLLQVGQGQDRDEGIMSRLLLVGLARQLMIKDGKGIDLVEKDVNLVLVCKLEELDDHLARVVPIKGKGETRVHGHGIEL